jgi:hypothetical protein
MNYLTFLDYQTLETTGKNIEKQLVEKDKQIEILKEKDRIKSEELDLMNERIKKMELDNQVATKKWKQIESLVDRLESFERKNKTNA